MRNSENFFAPLDSG